MAQVWLQLKEDYAVDGVVSRRRYHVRRLIPSASHGFARSIAFASYSRRGMMPLARRLAALRSRSRALRRLVLAALPQSMAPIVVNPNMVRSWFVTR